MSNLKNSLSSIKEKINAISPSFCAAKWTQVTLHLHNGRTHSCHHPTTHKVPLEELKNNPSALHNTCFKKEQRKDMIDGKRPKECQYCWNVEDLPNYSSNEFFSDRVIKSGSDWSVNRLHEIITSPWDANINPSYVEVSFSNICNFKCSYCSPVYSSRWTEEIETHGAYKTSNNFNNLEWYKANNEMPIHHKEHNPYVEAFWEWWPQLVKTLKIFRITGGEPLLAADTYKVLDFLYNEPQPLLELAVNTNGCIPNIKLNQFLEKSKRLLNENKIKNLTIFTSVDGSGKAAEYGRFGLNYSQWLINVDRFLTELPNTNIVVMCTTNIFSITSYTQFLKDLLELKEKHGSARISLDISILRYPQHQCLSILTQEYKTFMDDSLSFMKNNSSEHNKNGYRPSEILRLERLINFIKAPPHQNENIDISKAQKDFAIFVDEHDKRRGTNFLLTFPELANFYSHCKEKISNSSTNFSDKV